MVVAEEEAARQVGPVAGVPPEMRPGLDELGAEDPRREGERPRRRAEEEVVGHGPAGQEQGGVVDEGEVGEGGEVDGVEAPGLGAPEGAGQQAPGVAAPGRARPAHALAVEFGPLPQRGLDARGLGGLDPDPPAAVDHPPRDEVVVVGVERAHPAEEGVLVEEAVDKGPGLEDPGAVGRSAPRDHKDSAVNVVRGGDFEVVPLQVEAPQDIPETCKGEA